jgi:hypothetical protein
MKRRKQSNLSLMEQMELESKRQEKAKLKEEIKNAPKPYLLKRIWAGLLDFIFIVILMLGFQTLTNLVVINSNSYNDLIYQTHQMLEQSNLYEINENGDFVEYSSEDDLNNVIYTYYSINSYAIENNKLNDYNNSKKESNLFDVDSLGNYVVKSNIDLESLSLFYQSEYQAAIDFFESNPSYDKLLSKISFINLMISLSAITMATAIIYLLIPLLRKEGETPAQILLKLCIVDSRDMKQIKKWQVITRYIIILLFDYFLPVILLLQNGYFVPITIIITVGMMCITKNHISPHDFATQGMVVLKRRADEFSILKSLKKN